MRQQMRTGIGFYLLILVIIAAAVYVSGTLDQGGQKTYNIVNFTLTTVSKIIKSYITGCLRIFYIKIADHNNLSIW